MASAGSTAGRTTRPLSENVKLRVNRALETFPLLPADALVDIQILKPLFGRSQASIWRDVAAGRLPRPIKVNYSTRWRVGDIRAALANARVSKTAA